jgi:hypothetical protein
LSKPVLGSSSSLLKTFRMVLVLVSFSVSVLVRVLILVPKINK